MKCIIINKRANKEKLYLFYIFVLTITYLLISILDLHAVNDALRQIPAPTGPTVLTVSGEIKKANRGAFDPFADRLAAFHDLSFDRAYSFDRDALLALGRQEVTLKRPD